MSWRGFLLVFVVLALGLAGCGAKNYASEEEYLSQRAQELDADPAKATWELGAADSRFRIWELPSGQGWLDRIKSDGQVSIVESMQFDSPADAKAWIEQEASEGKAPALSIEDFRRQRQQELGAVSGKFLGLAPNGHLYGWQLPDGRYVLDTVVVDSTGSVTLQQPEEPEKAIFDNEGAMVAAAGELRANLKDYLSKREAELGGVVDYGELRRDWSIFGIRLQDGRYHLDIVRSEPDVFTGYIRYVSRDFDTLNDAVAWISQQVLDEGATWATATQYSLGGWALIIYFSVIMLFILLNIFRAQKGTIPSIRRIAGLDQIDEAVGRATEIARPVLMVPGLGQLNGITVQALTIFAYVIRTAARFGTPIRLLNADASVYAVAQEIARDVYISEGVPEQYDPTSVRFVSDRQFAFAAGVAGTIQRERVAATFFMGDFFAESMIFAENANMVGAIQVAATTQFTQTPFFIAACDYVLLGDEFYAASAYLGRQPVLVGSLIGVDWSKMLVMATVFIVAIIHSIQITRQFPIESLPPETRETWSQTNQQYLDWRKEELYFKRLPKIKR